MISLRDITKRYLMGDEEVLALAGLDLDIGRNEYVALVGPSGSGKSTLMNLVGCLDTPTSGSYLLNGRDTAQLGAFPEFGVWCTSVSVGRPTKERPGTVNVPVQCAGVSSAPSAPA